MVFKLGFLRGITKIRGEKEKRRCTEGKEVDRIRVAGEGRKGLPWRREEKKGKGRVWVKGGKGSGVYVKGEGVCKGGK